MPPKKRVAKPKSLILEWLQDQQAYGTPIFNELVTEWEKKHAK